MLGRCTWDLSPYRVPRGPWQHPLMVAAALLQGPEPGCQAPSPEPPAWPGLGCRHSCYTARGLGVCISGPHPNLLSFLVPSQTKSPGCPLSPAPVTQSLSLGPQDHPITATPTSSAQTLPLPGRPCCLKAASLSSLHPAESPASWPPCLSLFLSFLSDREGPQPPSALSTGGTCRTSTSVAVSTNTRSTEP